MRNYNIYSKDILEKRIREEVHPRVVVSFYRYTRIQEPQLFRDELYQKLFDIRVLGRIYIAREGVNAQLSVPENHYPFLRKLVDSWECLKGVYFNRSVDSRQDAFLKLKIKCRKKIVNDGLGEHLNGCEGGETGDAGGDDHLTPEEFNRRLNSKKTIAVDLRNHYESEVGRFQNAVCLPADNYRNGLKKLPALLNGKEDHDILLYCTGGIRCEKASVHLKNQGFKKVHQLKGGITSYFREVLEKNLPSRFIGKNFVFDRRLGEKISSDVIAHCHICGEPSDEHTNCANEECHILMIQCEGCKKKYKGCCSEECREIYELPEAIQKLLRRGRPRRPGTSRLAS